MNVVLALALGCSAFAGEGGAAPSSGTAAATEPAFTIALSSSTMRVPPGDSQYRTLTLDNPTNDPVTVTEIVLDPPDPSLSLEVASLPLDVPSGGKRWVRVRFTPSGASIVQSTIVVVSSSGTLRATLTAVGDPDAPSLAGGIGGLIGAPGTQIGSGGLPMRGQGFVGGRNGRTERDTRETEPTPPPSEPAPPYAALVTFGDAPVIDGTLTHAEILAVIMRNFSQLRYCYQREVQRNPSLAGAVTMRFVIGRDGIVTSATAADSTLASTSVQGCLEGRFRRWQFPKPPGGGVVEVAWPLLFSPASAQ